MDLKFTSMSTRTSNETIDFKIKNLRAFFTSDTTFSISFRIKQLDRLEQCILENEDKIYDALWKDLHKSPEEVYLTEISIVLNEINLHKKKLKKWAKPTKVKTPIPILPSKSYVKYEPLGLAFIMAPWNYPFQLIMNPLVGAISSGCVALLKPSPEAQHTTQLINQLILDYFDENYITVVQGEKDTNTYLFQQKFDVIFFTGSPRLGKIVMKAASEHLTPVVLELGGKSPCIVDVDADIKKAAYRIAWGKFINAGQTCIAPDYLYVHEDIKNEFLENLKKCIQEFYGKDSSKSRFYPRIITNASTNRLIELIDNNKVYFGGNYSTEDKFIEPTIMTDVEWKDKIMQEEIFGPILPILNFNRLTDVLNVIQYKEKPLALYYFGNEKDAQKVIEKTSSGGVCINDTLMHVANHYLPFGGVGNSGMGSYHGKKSFESFSHLKSIVVSPNWIDLSIKYAPYKSFKWIKKFI